MTSLATKAAKRLVLKHASVYEPQDPFYETWTDSKGKEKRRVRPPPPGLTKKEAALLRKIQRRAHYLDKGFSICGFRVGWSGIVGFIPGAGDILAASLNYFLVFRPAKKGAELPDWLQRKMFLNNAVSAGVGLVPLVGDVAIVIIKANSRNAKLLEEYLRVLGEEHIVNGLPDLTPQPPKLPGEQLPQTTQVGGTAGSAVPQDRDAEGPPAREHPAQPAAKQLVKDHSDGNLLDGPQTASQRVQQTQEPVQRRRFGF